MYEARQNPSQLSPAQATTEILKEFYSLHYPNKKLSGLQQKKLRTNSVMAVNQHYNPQIDTQQQALRRKRSVAEKISQQNQNVAKSKERKHKQQTFSFKRMLSAKEQRAFISEYFSSCPPKYADSLQELSNRSSNIKQAVQRCKDEKLKISKVLGSTKQSQDTKMDYLQLKRKEIEQQKMSQIRAIYDQFFRKEYEQLYGAQSYNQFCARINQTVSQFRNKIFGT